MEHENSLRVHLWDFQVWCGCSSCGHTREHFSLTAWIWVTGRWEKRETCAEVCFMKNFGLLQSIQNLDNTTKSIQNLLPCFRCSVYLEWAYIVFTVFDYKVVVPCVTENQPKTCLQVSMRFKLWKKNIPEFRWDLHFKWPNYLVIYNKSMFLLIAYTFRGNTSFHYVNLSYSSNWLDSAFPWFYMQMNSVTFQERMIVTPSQLL